MRITSRTLPIAVVSAALALAAASPALAAPQTADDQRTQPAQTASQGPLVVTPIESTFVVAPVAKVTRIAGVNSGLAGFYAGKVFEDRLLIGGSVIWLANPRNTTELWYGGLVAGWTFWDDGPFSLRAQTLVGGGQATHVFDITNAFAPVGHISHGPFGNFRIRVSDSFFTAEPELTLQMRASERVRVNLGAGYRATTSAFGLGHELRGATGTLGVEFRIGK